MSPERPERSDVCDAATLSRGRLSPWDAAHAFNMAIACGLSYWVVTQALWPLVSRDNDLLGGMWAAAATVFVLRPSGAGTVSASLARFIATCVSFALCFAYLWFFPFTVAGLAVLIGLGTLAMGVLGRRDEVITTGITTIVVMVVAAMSPEEAWQQPLFRLLDTVVGIVVGVACKWLASLLYVRLIGGENQ
ncbi:MAG: FUSC family protein [Alphaproteobacteria bacterium]|nr:FUSC family protein [Alphaproteobacteria bacterium]